MTNPTINLCVEVPVELHEAIKIYLDAHTELDQDQLIQDALDLFFRSKFLLQEWNERCPT